MLIILTTHPIQYQVPLWQALARDGRVRFEVWYLTGHAVTASRDREFGKTFAWDLDMLSGYPHKFLEVRPGATPNTFLKCRPREALADRLRASGAKALWIQGWQVAGYWQAVWAAKRAGVEVWLRAESNDLAPVALWKRGVKRIVLGQFLHRVDRFLCIGTANRRLYQRYGVPADRLYSAPYAVDNERFKQQAEESRKQKAEIRKSWGIPEDTFCVLFCGKFIPKKRPMDLVRAASLLLEAGSSKMEDGASDSVSHLRSPISDLPRIHLLFVGSGELGSELRDSCHVVFDAEGVELKMEDRSLKIEAGNCDQSPISPLPSSALARPRATFAGFLNQTEISKAYVAADCLVLPSDYGETWGLVVNEAMASGLPCLISDRCGSAVDLGNNEPNFVFPCGDATALADCWLKMAGHRNSSVRQPPSLDETVATVVSLCEGGR